MGHPEPASGLSSMCKLIVTAQSGVIPKNLHYKTPNPKLEGITSGKLKVVAEHTKLPSGFISVNNFGFGGANTHVILNQTLKMEPSKALFEDKSPRLVVHAARTESGAQKIIQKCIDNQTNLEFLNL